MDLNHQRIMIMRIVFFSTISVLLVIGYVISEFIPISSHAFGFAMFFLFAWIFIFSFVLYEKMR